MCFHKTGSNHRPLDLKLGMLPSEPPAISKHYGKNTWIKNVKRITVRLLTSEKNFLRIVKNFPLFLDIQ